MQIDRLAVYNKTDRHCAYCGTDIKFEKFHVDHYWPQFLAHLEPDLDNNRFSNLMPSCIKCNLHKSGMRPEEWRSELQRQVSMIRQNSQFDRALRFGQLQITEKPIVFYFEKLQTKG